MSSQSLITSRDDKGRHAVRLFEVAYDKAKLDLERAQWLNERGGEFQKGIEKLIDELTLSDQYAGEEVKSNYGYLSGYTKPAAITDQIDILHSHWPNLNPDAALCYCREVYPKFQLPGWVEGPFAIIRPGFFSDKYGEELVEVLKAIAKDRKGKFVNYRDGQLGPEYLRQSERTFGKLRALIEQQPGSDILIASAQFGIRHRGRSVRRSREVFASNEFGSGAKDVGTMIITNPSRLEHYDDLWIDSAGDEFSLVADGGFSLAPYFRFFCVGQMRFHARWVGSARVDYGSASFFFPQQIES